MNTTFIYVLKCPKTGDVKYVGKSNNPQRRYYAHIRIDRTASYHKINWIQKLLKEGLKPELEILEEVSEENWKERERYYISKYRELYNLTNCKDGGEGSFRGNQTSFKKGQISHNKGSRKKKKCAICKNLFEVSPSGDKKYKCCSMECSSIYRSENPNKGCFKKGSVPWSKGGGYSTSKKGSKVSEEIRNKISNTLKGRLNGGSSKKIKQIDKLTGITINEFPSAAEASRQTGIKLSNILNNTSGRSMSAGGFKWEKENENC